MNWNPIANVPPPNTRLLVTDGVNISIARYVTDSVGRTWMFEGNEPFVAVMWVSLPKIPQISS